MYMTCKGISQFSRLAITTHCPQIKKSSVGSGTWYNPEVNTCYRPKRFIFFKMQDCVYIGKKSGNMCRNKYQRC